MVTFNMYPTKVGVGLIAGIMTSMTTTADNLYFLFETVMVFELIDFCTGVLKSKVVSKRKGQRFAFESVKAWRTIYKCVFILVGICLAWLLEKSLAADHELRLANYFTGFCCGVEFWSFLENAAEISEHPVFLWLRRFMRTKVEDQIGAKFEAEEENHNPDNNE